jgi:hypothetical protein
MHNRNASRMHNRPELFCNSEPQQTKKSPLKAGMAGAAGFYEDGGAGRGTHLNRRCALPMR